MELLDLDQPEEVIKMSKTNKNTEKKQRRMEREFSKVATRGEAFDIAKEVSAGILRGAYSELSVPLRQSLLSVLAISDVLMSKGLVTKEELDEAIAKQAELVSTPETLNDAGDEDDGSEKEEELKS